MIVLVDQSESAPSGLSLERYRRLVDEIPFDKRLPTATYVHFDGLGDDVRALKKSGFAATDWDPFHHREVITLPSRKAEP